MIKVKVKTNWIHIVFETVVLLATIAGSLYIAAIANKVALWIFETLILLVLLYFGGKSILNKIKPFYVAVPLREDMFKDKKKIVEEPTKRGGANEKDSIKK